MSRSVRQKARLLVQDQLVRRREVLAAREARIIEQVLEATAAMLERDRVVAESERRIGHAIHALTVTEALPAAEAAALCGLDIREVNRLLRAGPDGTGLVRPAKPMVQDLGNAGER